MASTEHPPAAIHEVRHAEIFAVCAVAYEFEEDGCDERGGLGEVETNAAREAFLRERARGVKRELVHLSGRETHRRRRTRPGRGLGLGAGRDVDFSTRAGRTRRVPRGAELAHAGAGDAKGEGSLAKRGGVGDALGKGREELPDRGEAFGAEGPRVPNARARTRGRIGLGERGERGGDARLPGAGRVTPATTRGHAEVLRETTGRRWRRRWGSASGPRARRAPTRGHAGGRGDDEHRRGFPGKDVRQGTGSATGKGRASTRGAEEPSTRPFETIREGGSRGSADTRRMADESETTLLMPRAGRCANRKRRIRGDVRTRKKKQTNHSRRRPNAKISYLSRLIIHRGVLVCRVSTGGFHLPKGLTNLISRMHLPVGRFCARGFFCFPRRVRARNPQNVVDHDGRRQAGCRA